MVASRLLIARLAGVLPVVLVVLLVSFLLIHLAPGDAAVVIAGEQASPQDVARIRQSLMLDQPLYQQFLHWLVALSKGDLGISVFSGKPVAELIWVRMGPTVALTLTTIGVSVLVGVPLGTLAAWKSDGWLDRVLSSGAILAFSLPVFLIGYLLINVFGLQTRWLPVQGYQPLTDGVLPWLRHLVLPTACLSLVFIAMIARMARSSVAEVLGADFVRSAAAKGVPDLRILFVHALRNASVPIAATIGLGIAQLLGGVSIVENVFAIPGVGRLIVDAVLQRDFPVIRGVILAMSLLYVLVNLLIDLSYVALDPRMR